MRWRIAILTLVLVGMDATFASSTPKEAGDGPGIALVADDSALALARQTAANQAAERIATAIEASQIWAESTPFQELQGTLQRPLHGRVEEAFGPRPAERLPTTVRHRGVTYSVRRGARVYAIAPGIVQHTGELNGYGHVVIIDHGDGYHSVTANLSEVGPDVGAIVRANEEIGRTDRDGPRAGTRVYFEIRRHGDPLDPADWIGRRR